MRVFGTRAFRLRYALLVLTVAACGLTLYAGVVVPLRDWVARHGAVAEKEAAQRDLQREIDELAVMEALNETLATELETLGRELRTYNAQEVYIRELLRILNAQGVTLKKMNPEVDAASVRLRFETEGSFAQILAAAHAIEIHPLPTRIDGLRLTPKEGTLEARFEIVLWMVGDEG